MQTYNLRSSKRVYYESTSKGNQPKWFQDGYWYKADAMGYEGIAEYLVSKVLEHSTIANMRLDYEMCSIASFGAGCRSKHFLEYADSLVTLSGLLKLNNIQTEELFVKNNPAQSIENTLDFLFGVTGVDFRDYFKYMYTLDMVVLNEDRHLNNIAFIYNDTNKSYKGAPLFDNGLSLLSDTNDYLLTDSISKCIKKSHPRLFWSKYEKTVDYLGIGFTVDADALLNFLDNTDVDLGRAGTVLRSMINRHKDVYIKSVVNDMSRSFT